jgi:hypothetical protein
VRPKVWQAASVMRSQEQTDSIERARKQSKARLATTLWMNELGRRGICCLEANGIEWRSVEVWLDALDPHEAYAARRFVRQVLQVLADDAAPLRERFEVHNELYRRLIAAGILD